MTDKEKVFTYLDALRESGVTNMFGTPRCVMKVFNVSSNESIKLVAEWMDNFEQRHPRNT
jgi:hypothetical protein